LSLKTKYSSELVGEGYLIGVICNKSDLFKRRPLFESISIALLKSAIAPLKSCKYCRVIQLIRQLDRFYRRLGLLDYLTR
jgi:hypothetical protein